MTIPVRKIGLTFEAEGVVAPPVAIGAMWRSVFGAALRQRAPELYAVCFQPRRVETMGSRFEDPPAPFALDAAFPEDILVMPGETLSLSLTLFGDIDAAPMLDAFDMAARKGLGKARRAARLIDAAAIWRNDGYENTNPLDAPPHHPEPPPALNAVRIALTTPVRLRAQGGVVGPDRFSPTAWLLALARRATLLSLLYGDDGTAPKIPEHMDMLETQIWLHHQHRWSAKQRREVDLSGVMGSFMLPLENNQYLWPLLWLGQWLQVGSGVTSGLGAYRIRPVT